MFESNEEHQERILSLGKITISQVTLKDYDGDEGYFTLELDVDKKIVNRLEPNPDDVEQVLYIDNHRANKCTKKQLLSHYL